MAPAVWFYFFTFKPCFVGLIIPRTKHFQIILGLILMNLCKNLKYMY